MTFPTCCATGTAPCPVGCFDELHVRALARTLVAAIFAYLRAKDEIGPDFRVLWAASFAYAQAAADPRAARAWPALTYHGLPCDPRGWPSNASTDDLLDVATALRGPAVDTVTRHGPTARVTTEWTFRLPPMRAAVIAG